MLGREGLDGRDDEAARASASTRTAANPVELAAARENVATPAKIGGARALWQHTVQIDTEAGTPHATMASWTFPRRS